MRNLKILSLKISNSYNLQVSNSGKNMPAIRNICEKNGFPFTIDSLNSSDTFQMGEASGCFSYIEDPDGTLIEFVEAFKIPIIKKLGLSIDLRKRNPEKPLPDFFIKLLQLHRVKK